MQYRLISYGLPRRIHSLTSLVFRCWVIFSMSKVIVYQQFLGSFLLLMNYPSIRRPPSCQIESIGYVWWVNYSVSISRAVQTSTQREGCHRFALLTGGNTQLFSYESFHFSIRESILVPFCTLFGSSLRAFVPAYYISLMHSKLLDNYNYCFLLIIK